MGHTVVLAENGIEALKLAGAHLFDLVLMDLHMPIMDGLTATRNIRQLSLPFASVPIVALTANGSAEARSDCYSAGMNGFLAKPVHATTLYAEIARVLSDQEVLVSPAAELQKAPPHSDHDHLRQFIEDFGEEDVLPLIHLFLSETRVRLEALAVAVSAKDSHMLERESHTLNGNAGNLGFFALAETAGALCQACRETNWGRATTLADRLRSQFEALQETLKQHYPNYARGLLK